MSVRSDIFAIFNIEYKIFSIFNIDYVNFRNPFSARYLLSEKKRPGLSEPFLTVSQLSQLIYMKNSLEHFALEILLTSSISTQMIDQLARRGNIPPVPWQCFCNFYDTMTSGKSRNKLFVPHRIMAFLRLNQVGLFSLEKNIVE